MRETRAPIAQRGKSHPLVGWVTNAQASLLHFYSMAIKRYVPSGKIILYKQSTANPREQLLLS